MGKDIQISALVDNYKAIDISIVDQTRKDIDLCRVELKLSEITRVGMKTAKFSSSFFTQTIFKDVYAREAEFTDVAFTGSTFINCNFEKAKFKSCDFRYCTFVNSKFPEEELLACLPTEPNIREDLCRNLKINFNQLGNKKASDKFLHKEIKASQKQMWAIFRRKSAYYKERFDLIDRLENLVKYLYSKLTGFMSGNGYNVHWLFVSYFTFIAILALSVLLFDICFVKTYQMGDVAKIEQLNFAQSFGLMIGESIKYSFIEYRPVNFGGQLLLLLARALGLIYFGLLAATIYRRIAR